MQFESKEENNYSLKWEDKLKKCGIRVNFGSIANIIVFFFKLQYLLIQENTGEYMRIQENTGEYRRIQENK